MARRIAAALITLGLFHSGTVSALGLGELTLDSFLNEPFKASVDLLNTGGLADHQIRIRLATPEDFERMGVERAYFLTSIDFSIEIDDGGKGRILMSSDEPVLEPYLDFIVEARWPSGRLLREYTVLVDPPVFDESSSIVVSANEKAQQAKAESDAKKNTNNNSGDRVSIKKSGLAEGAMPERNFGSKASSEPIAGNKYMIRRDETLWGIAKRAKPEGSSVHQTMLDIQRLNPKAFLGGNINRIKAGYIIYLPTASDLSSDNFSEAVAEVRDQNQAWRDGVDTAGYSSRSSLRISTEAESDEDTSSSDASTADEGYAASGGSAGADDTAASTGGASDDRVDALAQQVDTLERIVSLKDDQIAALQSALAEARIAADGSAGSFDTGSLAEPAIMEVEESMAAALPATLEAVSDMDSSAEDTAAAEAVEAASVSEKLPAPEPAKVAPVASQPEPKTEAGFFSGYVIYVVGLLLAAVAAAAFFWQRRRETDEVEESQVSDDVYADIKLEDESIELDAEQAPVEKAEAEPADGQEGGVSQRGYGQRKNDQYANDMDSGDALAEADIYIAYGRYPQAVDLLKTAIVAEPNNTSYKLKLMQVSGEMGDQAEVMAQLTELKQLGDAGSIEKAEDIVKNLNSKPAAPSAPLTQTPTPLVDDVDVDADVVEPLNLEADSPELDLPDLDMPELDMPELDMAELDMAEDNEVLNLEDDFGELEIEGLGVDSVEDELDLSADFEEDATEIPAADDEEMIFAADGDAMSTKLDLARAYLDMGDQDGARQIFEEVVAGGNEAQQEEARALIEQLD